MTTRMQKIRLGVFMLIAAILLVGTVGTLAGLKMWNPKDRFFARFHESISGLEVGSTVKMKGVRVGQVERITISRDAESVIVTLALDPETPITVDTRAVLTSIGITGLQFVELTGGSAKSERVPPNTRRSIIRSGKSTLQTLTGKATHIAFKMEGLLNNFLRMTSDSNQERFSRLLENTGKLAASWEKIASANEGRIQKIMGNVERATLAMEKAATSASTLAQDSSGSIREILAAATGTVRALNRMMQTLNPQATLTAINSAADSFRKRVDDPSFTKAMASLNGAATKLSKLMDESGQVLLQRDRQLAAIMKNLDQASFYLKDFARSIKERPSLLLRGQIRKERDIP